MSGPPTNNREIAVDAIFDRLAKHLLRRLRGASASEAIFSAINSGLLAAKAFPTRELAAINSSQDRTDWRLIR